MKVFLSPVTILCDSNLNTLTYPSLPPSRLQKTQGLATLIGHEMSTKTNRDSLTNRSPAPSPVQATKYMDLGYSDRA